MVSCFANIAYMYNIWYNNYIYAPVIYLRAGETPRPFYERTPQNDRRGET